jgi:hypothetical protein
MALEPAGSKSAESRFDPTRQSSSKRSSHHPSAAKSQTRGRWPPERYQSPQLLLSALLTHWTRSQHRSPAAVAYRLGLSAPTTPLTSRHSAPSTAPATLDQSIACGVTNYVSHRYREQFHFHGIDATRAARLYVPISGTPTLEPYA